MKRAFTVGIDYGTNSVRSVVFDCADGREIGTTVFDYPSGDQASSATPATPISPVRIPGTTSRVWRPR